MTATQAPDPANCNFSDSMLSSALMRTLALVLLGMLLLANIATTAAQDEASVRAAALAALKTENLLLRRQAYEALGSVGLAHDLPVLYAALYDPDEPIRAIAQTSIWKATLIWCSALQRASRSYSETMGTAPSQNCTCLTGPPGCAPSPGGI